MTWWHWFLIADGISVAIFWAIVFSRFFVPAFRSLLPPPLDGPRTAPNFRDPDMTPERLLAVYGQTGKLYWQQ